MKQIKKKKTKNNQIEVAFTRKLTLMDIVIPRPTSEWLVAQCWYAIKN